MSPRKPRHPKNDEDFAEILQKMDEQERVQDRDWEIRFEQVTSEDDNTDSAWDSIKATPATQDEIDAEPPPAEQPPVSSVRRSYSISVVRDGSRPLVRRRPRAGKAMPAVSTEFPVRMVSAASGQRTHWDLLFRTSDEFARYQYVRRALHVSFKGKLGETERQALLLDRFRAYLGDSELTTRQIAKRFRIRYDRFARLVRKFDALLQQLQPDYETAVYVFGNRPVGHDLDEYRAWVVLQETGEVYLHDKRRGFTPVPPDQVGRLAKCDPRLRLLLKSALSKGPSMS